LTSILPLLVASLALGAPPAPKRLTDAERGKELYERHCVACHGATAAGDGPAASALVAPVPDLRGKVDPSAARVDVVRFGRGAMPAFEASFDEADAQRVLRHMASTREAPPPADDAAEAPDDAAPDPGDAQPAEAPEGGD
jgi:high-affinity iron transporter